MNAIVSNDASCMYCYKCLRNCPVKSISFNHGKAKIIDEDCIQCGICIEVCPQKARTYVKSIDEFKKFIGKKFMVSLAPSFFAHFDQPYKIISLLKKLGATVVQETAVGAELVSGEYARYFLKNEETVISTACPVIVYLAERYFPEVLGHLLPVVSPMVAHATFLKQKFGDLPVVFLGPCVAKKSESQLVDIVITFEEFDEFIKNENFQLDQLIDELPTPPYPDKARMYPTSGGINYTIDGDWKTHISIEGIENVMNIFSKIDEIKTGFFIEASACIGSCINGPAIRKDINILEKRRRIMNHSANLNTEKNLIEFEAPSIDLHKKFSSKFSKVYVDEKAVQQVLKSLGKDDMKKQLNCGACGYESCKDKAVAVVLGKAEKEMCITYLVDKLKAATNRVVEESPNAIFIYKGNCLIYKNKAAEKLFLDTANLISLLNEIKIFSNRIYEIPDKGFFFVKSFTLPEDSGEVLLLVDMTKEKLQEERLKEIKHETLNKIEEMLARQMRIAQEIAGLLGESIAETKSRFVELRKFMEE
ncbi:MULTISPECIES: [Fe-Fe] hydrogenase large subunit C-terminal domain-containing protein [Pseudothermotoga]|uniref:4Fe-4S ferredoxin iron-sulfur binding domain protein n=3 Tax=Pseudothermotoga TaxID=1643951 RepID=A8F5T8_PSELT|nr:MULTISPECIES: [Fe-Fe] hydrogenase large subunit C-terminal domain-containing protein [Pseudothermotoga]ABV33522.1 4Fe-4S ferredoxin iron-sulfur binding domain protein [Pseudothermotoga lettingae TMO]KUK20709.1 MAG: 4Fe-4S ferredoxin iron-sulfur binding domain protein [Pseudothermotoga lettingae]MDI3495292.1 hypothetical protein [Pseudothermotoga sp.]MDK2883830.1 hypothetical protein [Pseudothermotoga sp.]GLI49564.1 4Fe-4S ferredoxin [Pseudothermotoga lettingae TMO]